MSGRVIALAGGAILSLAAVGMAIYFGKVGLDNADKLASIIGLFVAIIGVALTVSGLWLNHRATNTQTGQSIGHSRVSGDVAQIRNVQGGIRIGRPQPSGATVASRPPSQPSSQSQEAKETQSIRGSEIGGSVYQVENAGDLTIDP